MLGQPFLLGEHGLVDFPAGNGNNEHCRHRHDGNHQKDDFGLKRIDDRDFPGRIGLFQNRQSPWFQRFSPSYIGYLFLLSTQNPLIFNKKKA
jgi:hypothetical protein